MEFFCKRSYKTDNVDKAFNSPFFTGTSCEQFLKVYPYIHSIFLRCFRTFYVIFLLTKTNLFYFDFFFKEKFYFLT